MKNDPGFITLTLRQQLDNWLDTLTAQGKSRQTSLSYRAYLSPFVDWCEQRAVCAAPQVSLPLLEGWQRYLRAYRKADGQPYSHNGQRARLNMLRVWFRWLLQRHQILYNPADLLVLPKKEKRLPAQILNVAETGQVLDSQDCGTLRGFRNRVMLEVLWSSGLRRMELANLRTGDIDSGRGVLYVRQGKGQKDRVVPIGTQALGWLKRYLANVRPRLAARHDSGYLFISDRGRGLSRDYLSQLVGHIIREQAHLDKPGACHLFRHSMATQMLDNGADTRHIQAILGHERLETTQIYTRVAIGHLKQVHQQTHPAERLEHGVAEIKVSDNHARRGGKPDNPR
ncbi:site-specific tyrosine recombinase XerC [Xenorhabdus szentirmaii]|uniref:site-specific tyrosine recombinase XerC n=1 Tax=Xenorhabdus szentirmaii TaxID=290112 RepID=UPI0019A19C25|nr:site-specific tyrosine recombinase XerC [Xenorhabdus sp. 38]MBD2782726.1 site-specific tyrosine recombinase XerC [Xenorhabdus sp. 38]